MCQVGVICLVVVDMISADLQGSESKTPPSTPVSTLLLAFVQQLTAKDNADNEKRSG